MKKVGIVSNLMTGYGGVQTCILSLIKGLNDKGIIPDVISDQEPNSKLWEELGLNANISIVPYSISLSSYQKYKKLLQPIWEFVFYLKTSWIKKEYDFLYIFQPNVLIDSNHEHLFYLSMSPRAKNFTTTPLFSKLKGLAYKYFIRFWHPIFEFQNYNCVINSHFTAKYFEEYYGKKIDIIYPSNLIKKEEYSIQQIKEKRTVLFLSRIASYKRPHLILKLAKKYSNFKFFIIGGLSKDNKPYYNELISILSLNNLDNVEILINLPHDKMVDFLKRSEFYFFGAKNEHFGITTVEAMLFGAIPFVHNSGGQKEIVPFDNLRFEDDNMEEKFEEIINCSEIEYLNRISEIKNHSLNFTEDIFISKMLMYLNN